MRVTKALLTSLTVASISLSAPLLTAQTKNQNTLIDIETTLSDDAPQAEASVAQLLTVIETVVQELEAQGHDTSFDMDINIDELQSTLSRWEGLAADLNDKQDDPTGSLILLASEFLQLKSQIDRYQEATTKPSTAVGHKIDTSGLTPFELPHDIPLPIQNDRADPCKFAVDELPANTKIFASGAYSGREIDYQIDSSGHQATQFDVLVNHPGEQMALWLGAYEPTIWNIGWTADTHIVGVAVSGYHRQVVAGLPDSVPLLNLEDYDCTSNYPSEGSLASINAAAESIFHRETDGFVQPNKDSLVIVGKTAAGNDYLTSPDTPPSSYHRVDVPLAGEAGLNQLVSEGKIRPLTSADRQRWASAKMAADNVTLPPVLSGGEVLDIEGLEEYMPGHIHNGYVILEAITIPAGLYGGHSATFFLEEDVPFPKGDLGHSTLYNFATLSCQGSIGC